MQQRAVLRLQQRFRASVQSSAAERKSCKRIAPGAAIATIAVPAATAAATGAATVAAGASAANGQVLFEKNELFNNHDFPAFAVAPYACVSAVADSQER